jgi:hypothetical protein
MTADILLMATAGQVESAHLELSLIKLEMHVLRN